MYVFQNSGELAPIMDAEGRCHRIPSGERWLCTTQISMDTDKGGAPVEKPQSAEKFAAQLVKDGRFYGVVILKEKQTPTGSELDFATAEIESTRIREQAETELIQMYVKRSKEQALINMPVRPPAVPIEKILEKRGEDLQKDYGITPVGYKVSQRVAQRDQELIELRKEVAELKELMRDKRRKEPVSA